MIDYLSIHRYWERSNDYYTFMGQSAMDFEEKIRVTADEIDAVRAINISANEIETVSAMKSYKNPIYLSVDEYGSFGRNFQSVLPVAQCLNSFIRHADIVKMANFTMMTSLLSTDRENGSFKSPLFYTFKLFSNNCRGNSIDTYVQCDTFNTEKYKGIPFLDVTSTYSEGTKTVYINVVNRHKDKAIAADILSSSGNFEGKAEISLLNAASIEEPFSFDKREQYMPETKEIKTNGNKITYSFPAHSFTQIKVKVSE